MIRKIIEIDGKRYPINIYRPGEKIQGVNAVKKGWVAQRENHHNSILCDDQPTYLQLIEKITVTSTRETIKELSEPL